MLLILGFVVSANSGWAAAASANFDWPADYGTVPDDAVILMTRAMPKKAVIKPLKPRKVLIYSQCRGFIHKFSIPYGAKALELMGKQTGAFETVVTTDSAMFEKASLQQFDAVVMNSATGEAFLPLTWDRFSALPKAQQEAMMKKTNELRQNLVDFVKGGKGLIGFHAATDSNYTFPEYGEMIGAYFDCHPWHYGWIEYMKIDDPKHPLCKPFRFLKGKSMEISDEIYQMREKPYSREKLRVLLTLDASKTSEFDKELNQRDIHRKDGDFAISWIHNYGKGRVFYCSLGHDFKNFYNPTLLSFYLGGIQYALGDLKVDATPSAVAARKMGARASKKTSKSPAQDAH
jgi:type 1 glutamine amidotransferase